MAPPLLLDLLFLAKPTQSSGGYRPATPVSSGPFAFDYFSGNTRALKKR